jgi:Protein of unknown function, DUF481
VNFKYLILSGLFLCASPLFARDKVDVLVMNNGDRLTCEIKGLESGVLYVGLDYAQGTVSMNWAKVNHIESKQLFLIKTQDGENYVGTISSVQNDAARPLSIEVVDESEKSTVFEPAQVIGIEQTSNNFWHRFSGAINSGFTYSKANDTRQYTLGTTTRYLRESWTAGANYNSTLSGSAGVTTSTRNNLQTNYRHLMRWDNWFYTGVGSFLQSTEQQIQLQSNAGAGIGRYLKNTNHATITAFGGLAYQNTNYSEVVESQPKTQNTIAGMMGADVGLFRFDKMNVNLSATAMPAFNQPGRLYTNVNSTYFVKFWGNFTWNFSFYGSWDNQPPRTFSGSDYGMTSGLGWTFGNYNSFNK